jgi:hypothetical protein
MNYFKMESHNDLNMLEHSPIFARLVEGNTPKRNLWDQ